MTWVWIHICPLHPCHTGDSSCPYIQSGQDEGKGGRSGWSKVWIANLLPSVGVQALAGPFPVFIHVLMRSESRGAQTDRPGAWRVRGMCEAWVRRQAGNWGGPPTAEATVELSKIMKTWWVQLLVLLSQLEWGVSSQVETPKAWAQREAWRHKVSCGWDIYGSKFHGCGVSCPGVITLLLHVMSHLLSCTEVHVKLLWMVHHTSVTLWWICFAFFISIFCKSTLCETCYKGFLNLISLILWSTLLHLWPLILQFWPIFNLIQNTLKAADHLTR